MALKFKDIKDWKPSTISIVDQPSHPMAVLKYMKMMKNLWKIYHPRRGGSYDKRRQWEK